eukprot:gene10470-11565_t
MSSCDEHRPSMPPLCVNDEEDEEPSAVPKRASDFDPRLLVNFMTEIENKLRDHSSILTALVEENRKHSPYAFSEESSFKRVKLAPRHAQSYVASTKANIASQNAQSQAAETTKITGTEKATCSAAETASSEGLGLGIDPQDIVCERSAEEDALSLLVGQSLMQMTQMMMLKMRHYFSQLTML